MDESWSVLVTLSESIFSNVIKKPQRQERRSPEAAESERQMMLHPFQQQQIAVVVVKCEYDHRPTSHICVLSEPATRSSKWELMTRRSFLLTAAFLSLTAVQLHWTEIRPVWGRILSEQNLKDSLRFLNRTEVHMCKQAHEPGWLLVMWPLSSRGNKL